MGPSPDTLAEALRPALLRVSRRLRQEAHKDGLSSQDALLLGRIKMNPGAGVSELADSEGVSRPTMSTQVKRLEMAGLIARTGDEDDRRRSGLAISREGLRKLEAIRRRRNDWLAARLAQMSPDERARLEAAAGPLLDLAMMEP